MTALLARDRRIFLQNSSWRALNLKKIEIRRKRGQAFFLTRAAKLPLRKQRTRFFSLLFCNPPLKKKRSLRSGQFSAQSGGSVAEWPQLRANEPAEANLLPDFFLEVSRSAAERTILCPLFSQHPQNQGDEKKSLSAGPLPARFRSLRGKRCPALSRAAPRPLPCDKAMHC